MNIASAINFALSAFNFVLMIWGIVMIQVGQKVQFDPIREHKGFGSRSAEPKIVTATVVYVNEENQWFTAEYTGVFGDKIRTAFKFWDIGRAVKICGK